jgi:hypothetical protein
MRAVLSRAAWLLLAAAALPAGGLRADPPRAQPASQADETARESRDGDAQEEERRGLETPMPSGQGTRVLTRAEKVCRQRHGCTNPAAACRPCDR